MILVKPCVIFLVLLLACIVSCPAQQRVKPVLVDAFEHVPCDDLLARIDSFLADLRANPQDEGFVILPAGGTFVKGYKRWITAAMYYRRVDRSRVRIVVSSQAVKSVVQLWRVPPDADLPAFTEVPEAERHISRRFVFGYADENGECPSFSPDLYAALIKQNQGSYGRIVVYGNSWMARQSLASDYLPLLRKEFELRKDQIRVSYVQRPGNTLTEAEFWFVPTPNNSRHRGRIVGQ